MNMMPDAASGDIDFTLIDVKQTLDLEADDNFFRYRSFFHQIISVASSHFFPPIALKSITL